MCVVQVNSIEYNFINIYINVKDGYVYPTHVYEPVLTRVIFCRGIVSIIR